MSEHRSSIRATNNYENLPSYNYVYLASPILYNIPLDLWQFYLFLLDFRFLTLEKVFDLRSTGYQ